MTLEEMKENFNTRYQRSPVKEVLLNREIECYEFVLNPDMGEFKKFLNPHVQILWSDIFKKKFNEYSHNVNDRDIFDIKRAFLFFILNGSDIKDAPEWYKKEIIDYNNPGNSQNYTAEEINILGYEFVNQVKTYYYYLEWLKSYPTTDFMEYLIPKEYELYIDWIFLEFKTYFSHETKKSWKERFFRPDYKPEPIKINRTAIEDSDKLVLLGILDAVQDITGSNFNFNNFVLKRFGLKAFEKMVSDHQSKKTFNKTKATCQTILDKMKVK
jgi:hypothetical protein